MTHAITFTDKSMTIAADICRASALANGCDTATICNPQNIDSDFMWENRDILSQKRGSGFWLWKSYFIDRELAKMKDDDYLVYCDAGVELVNNVNHIIDRMDQDIFLFANQYKHVEWTKGNVMDGIIPEWRDGRYDHCNQVQASVIVVKNTKWARSFISEWLKYCQVPGVIDDSPSITPNYTGYSEGRHDQSVLCCLQIKHSIKLHYWAASYNCGAFTYSKDGYHDPYPILFHHHRCRNNEIQEPGMFRNYFHKKYPSIV